MQRRVAFFLCLGIFVALGVAILLRSRGDREPSSVKPPTPLNSTARPAALGPVEKAASEEAAAAPAEAVDVTRGAIRGRVFLEAPPTPAPGARVVAILDGHRKPASTAIAKDSGAYEIDGLAPGRYHVWAWSAGWAMEPLPHHGEEVRVEPGQATDRVDRVLIPGSHITGRVLSAPTKEPIAGAFVQLESAICTEADATGVFRLDGARRGLRTVTAHADGFVRASAEVEILDGEAASVVLELEPGGIVEGRVTGLGDELVPGARVWTYGVKHWLGSVTDIEGYYMLEGVPLDAQEFFMFATIDSRFETIAPVRGFADSESRLTVDLQLAQGISLAGSVVDVEHRPIAQAKLYSGHSIDTPCASTDSEGRFRIDGVSLAYADLTAQKDGYAPASLKLQDLASDAERQAIELILSPSHFVAGRVVDLKGQPIHRAWVMAEMVGNHACPSPNTFTDVEGRFRLEGLESVFAGLAADKPGYCRSNGIQADVDTANVEIALEEAGLIAGRVVEKGSNREIPGFVVQVALARDAFRNTKEKGSLSRSLGDTGVQGHDGRFRLSTEIVPSVFYSLVVSAQGFAETQVDEVEAWAASQAREPLRIELERGGRLLGRVVSAATGQALEGVRVTHVTEAEESRESQWFDGPSMLHRVAKHATTNAAGEFTLEGLSDRPAVLLLARRGFARQVVAGVKLGTSEQVFPLSPGAAIEGLVQSADGKPISGAGVHTWVEKQGIFHGFPGTQTGPDGRFRLDDLPTGYAQVQFQPPSSEPNALRRIVRVTLRAGETTSADLTIATGSIAGRLTRRGVPVPEADISFTHASGENQGFQTDSKGRIRVTALPPGAYEVEVEGYGVGSTRQNPGLTRTVEVGSGETRCDIELASTLVSGRVVRGRTGEPVLGAHVALHDTEGWARAEATCAAGDDRFELEAPGTGTYWLAVSTKCGEAATGWLGPISVEEGVGLRDLVLPLGGAAELVVTITEVGTGRRLAGARVRVTGGSGAMFAASAIADAAGAARVGDLSPGRYRVEAETDEHVVQSAEIDIAESAESVSLALDRASRIVVEVHGDLKGSDGVCVDATVLSGGDPGWPHMLLCSPRPTSSPAQTVLKARPGSYRMRFVVIPTTRRSLDDPRNPVSELDISVPADGDAVVTLPAQ